MKSELNMSMMAVLTMTASALSLGASLSDKGKADGIEPNNAFRSDSTLRFMHRIHEKHEALKASGQISAEAARTNVCSSHGFLPAERAGCVAFMRQACASVGARNEVPRTSCVQFFGQAQPGFRTNLSKSETMDSVESGGKKDDAKFIPGLKDFQKGPNYGSKKAQKTTKETGEDQKKEFKKQEKKRYFKADPVGAGAGSPIGDMLKEAGEGPNYDGKKEEKPQEKKGDDIPDAAQQGPASSKDEDGILDSAQKGPNYKNGKAANVDKKTPEEKKDPDLIPDSAQRGPNYNKAKGKKAEEEREEKKELSYSVPGCKNSPKEWEDKKGRDCEDYGEGEWCTANGRYGDAWLDEWGTFEDVANKGKTAKEACCVCGGGDREEKEEEETDKESEDKKAAKVTKKESAKDESAKAPAPAPSAPIPALTGPILGTKAGRPLQEQGYSGELVAHEDRSTMTQDWGKEFGPKAGHRDIKTICAEHPGNEWCDLHGYYDKERSAAPMKSLAAVFVALLFACFY